MVWSLLVTSVEIARPMSMEVTDSTASAIEDLDDRRAGDQRARLTAS